MTMIFFPENMEGMIKYKRNRSDVFSVEKNGRINVKRSELQTGRSTQLLFP